jgi:serine/threonine-protein kinase
MPFQTGDTVGSYRIRKVAGQGASGTVFQVEHLVTKRVEALKVTSACLAAGDGQASPFQREIEVHASLNHAHIASVHNAFLHGSRMCLVMEWVEGESLSARIAAGSIPLSLAINITCQILSALDHAHRRQVIHRDIKPGNILLAANSHAKLADFGLAKPEANLELSQPGVALGSVHYMAPEQVRGLQKADARADLYSVGIVLYELVTGRRPFDGDDAFSVMKAHVEQPPVPPASLVRGLPAELNRIILRAMEKDPSRRFHTAAEFLGEMQAVDAGMATRSRPRRPAISRRIAIAASAAAAALILGWYYSPSSAIQEAPPAPEPPPAVAQQPAAPSKPSPGKANAARKRPGLARRIVGKLNPFRRRPDNEQAPSGRRAR